VGVAWYVFLQCFFLFFICVTTDVFAWYAPNTTTDDDNGGGGGGGGTTTSSFLPIPTSNHSNSTSAILTSTSLTNVEFLRDFTP